jgi:hypothetical protein
MLHACIAKFDMTENLKKILVFLGELNKADERKTLLTVYFFLSASKVFLS